MRELRKEWMFSRVTILQNDEERIGRLKKMWEFSESESAHRTRTNQVCLCDFSLLSCLHSRSSSVISFTQFRLETDKTPIFSTWLFFSNTNPAILSSFRAIRTLGVWPESHRNTLPMIEREEWREGREREEFQNFIKGRQSHSKAIWWSKKLNERMKERWDCHKDI